MAMDTKELNDTVKRLKGMNVQVTPDGRPYITPRDLLSSPAVERQIRSLAASNLAKRLR